MALREPEQPTARKGVDTRVTRPRGARSRRGPVENVMWLQKCRLKRAPQMRTINSSQKSCCGLWPAQRRCRKDMAFSPR